MPEALTDVSVNASDGVASCVCYAGDGQRDDSWAMRVVSQHVSSMGSGGGGGGSSSSRAAAEAAGILLRPRRV